MKKIYSLMVVAILGATTMFAQNFGASLDYAMWNGTMIENAESSSSIILGVNYSYNLSEDMDVVGSVGYGMGLGVIPMIADFNYGITDKISANFGMGMYMISDDGYKAVGVLEEGETERTKASTNEFGINLGLGYQVTNSITLGFNYNMVKGGDYGFNGMSFGLSYGFGAKSSEESKE